MEIRRFLPAFLLLCTFTAALSAQSSKPIVSDIKAVQSATETTVSWSVPKESQASITSLYVYRASEAIFSPDRLTSLAPVAVLSADMTSWQEKPETTLYYYAVVARLEDGTLYDLLIPSVNTTLYAAKVAQTVPEKAPEMPETVKVSEPAAFDGLRIKPLPSFRIFNTATQTQTVLTAQALSAAQELGIEGKSGTEATLYIVEEDMADYSTGDTYLLHDIVTRYMIRNNWSRAIEEFTALMQTYHSEEITARINLYLGQCSYFTKDYLGALQYFLHCETLYPDVSKIWIQTTINAFVLPDFSE